MDFYVYVQVSEGRVLIQAKVEGSRGLGESFHQGREGEIFHNLSYEGVITKVALLVLTPIQASLVLAQDHGGRKLIRQSARSS